MQAPPRDHQAGTVAPDTGDSAGCQGSSSRSMRRLQIRRLSRDDPQELAGIVRVCRSVGFNASLEQLQGTWLDSSPDSACFGAFAGERMVGVLACLAHEVLLGGCRSVAYQLGRMAIDPNLRNGVLFVQLLYSAFKELAAANASFAFGFPNRISAPLMAKMGARTIPMRRSVFALTLPRRLIALQLDTQHFFDALATNALVRFNQHQNYQWKLRQHGHADLVAVEYFNNWVWGRVETRRLPTGSTLRVFTAGGCEINKPHLFADLLVRLRKQHGVAVARFVSSQGSMLARAARVTLGSAGTEPMIYYPLSVLPDDLSFDAHVGLKDVY